MYRWHADLVITLRHWRDHHRQVAEETQFLEPLGRFRKRDAHDCGRTCCRLCHGENVDGVLSVQERLALWAFREQVEELITNLCGII